jgi:small conductance mechanosensitive channel
VGGLAQKLVVKASQRSQHLGETLFKFLSSMVRYVILAFLLIDVVIRFGV